MRKAGNRVRITAQLIDARPDTHLWPETYDRTLDDVFAIQDDIFTAEAFEQSIALYEQALAIDPDYAKAHSSLGLIAMRYDDDLAQAARHFERALQLDPADVAIIGKAGSLLFSLGRILTLLLRAQSNRGVAGDHLAFSC